MSRLIDDRDFDPVKDQVVALQAQVDRLEKQIRSLVTDNRAKHASNYDLFEEYEGDPDVG